jgi:hypothetical protein
MERISQPEAVQCLMGIAALKPARPATSYKNLRLPTRRMALSVAIPITAICGKPIKPGGCTTGRWVSLRSTPSYKSPSTAGSGRDFAWRRWFGGWLRLGIVGGCVEDFEEHAFQRHRRFYREQVAAALVEVGDEGRQRGLGQFAPGLRWRLFGLRSRSRDANPARDR